VSDKIGKTIGSISGVTEEGEDLGSLGSDGAAGLSDIVAQQLEHVSDVNYEPYGADVSAEELMSTGSVAPPPSLKCDSATMICLRGPCQHMWSMLTRHEAQAEVIAIQRTQCCSRHDTLMSLVDENVFMCSDWWPRYLRWVPRSARAALRPVLNKLYEGYLRATTGEDFSWRWWSEDVFELPASAVRKLRRDAEKLREAATKAEERGASPVAAALNLEDL